MTQKKFNKYFNKILEESSIYDVYTNCNINEFTSRYRFVNKYGEWLIEYDIKENLFEYSYDRISIPLMNILFIKNEEIQNFMKKLIESQYNMKNIIPECVYDIPF